MEEIVRFGRNNSLVGVVSTPDATSSPRRHAVIFLNAGMLPKVGPFRMNVELARAFQQMGFISLRFDLSGFGDSEINRPDLAFQERFVVDVQDAMDALQRRFSLEGFVLIGLCTGADNAHRTAVRDERVKGAVFLDGYHYPSLKYHLIKLATFLRDPARVLAYVQRKIQVPRRQALLGAGSVDGDASEIVEDSLRFQYQLPPRSEAQRDLVALAGRGVSLCFVYSGGIGGGYLYRSQLLDSLPKLKAHSKQVHLLFLPHADHTFSLRQDRDQLFQNIQDWLVERFS